jgi:hypothetical protein
VTHASRTQNLAVELKAESDHLNRRQREKELMLRQYRTADATLKDARDTLPNMKFQVGSLGLPATKPGQLL